MRELGRASRDGLKVVSGEGRPWLARGSFARDNDSGVDVLGKRKGLAEG